MVGLVTFIGNRGLLGIEGRVFEVVKRIEVDENGFEVTAMILEAASELTSKVANHLINEKRGIKDKDWIQPCPMKEKGINPTISKMTYQL